MHLNNIVKNILAIMAIGCIGWVHYGSLVEALLGGLFITFVIGVLLIDGGLEDEHTINTQNR